MLLSSDSIKECQHIAPAVTRDFSTLIRLRFIDFSIGRAKVFFNSFAWYEQEGYFVYGLVRISRVEMIRNN